MGQQMATVGKAWIVHSFQRLRSLSTIIHLTHEEIVYAPQILFLNLRRARQNREYRNRSNARKHVEEHARCFGQHLPQYTRAGVLEVEFTLGHGLRRDDMAGQMLLEGFRGTELDLACVQAVNVVRCHRGCRSVRVGSQRRSGFMWGVGEIRKLVLVR